MVTIPNRIETIQKVDRENPGLIHRHLEFCMACVRELNKAEHGQWGLNGKRGNRFDLSNDIVTKINTSVPWGCSIIDIIGSADTDNPSVVWIDQTQRTLDLGTVGLFVPVEGEAKPDPVKPADPVKPVPDTNKLVIEAIQELSRKLDSISDRLSVLESKETNVNNQPVIDAVVDQAGALLAGVTSEANRIIVAVKENKTECKVRNPFR